MPSNVRTVGFQAPLNPADQVQLQIQQQQAQQQMALADALRQRSMQDTEVAPGSRMSPLQGVARLVDALNANRLRREGQASEYEAGRIGANALAAQHDPTGTDIPQMPAGANPYGTSEQGRNLGQRIGDFFNGGPPVGSQQPGQQGSAAPSAPAAPPPPASHQSGAPAPGFNPDGTPTVPSNLDTSTDQGRQQALRLLNGQSAVPQGGIGSVGATAGADVAPSAPQGANTVSQAAAPADPNARAALIAALRRNAAEPQLGPATVSLLDVLKAKQAREAQLHMPGDGTTPEQEVQHQAIDDAIGGLRPPGAQPGPEVMAQRQAASQMATMPQTMPMAQPQPQQPAGPPDTPTAMAALLLQQGLKPGSPQFQAGMAAYYQQQSGTAPQRQAGPVMDAQVPYMTAREGYAMQAMYPEQWGAVVQAAHMPTDATRALIDAGVKPGSPEWVKGQRAYVAKTTQTPLNDDKRGYLTDPYTGQVVSYHPQISPDATPLFNAQGEVVGERTLPGAVQTIQDTTGARATGEAQGRLTQVYNRSTGQMDYHRESDVLAGTGGTYSAGAPLGTQAGAEDASRRSADGFHGDATVAAGAPQRRFLLNQIQHLASITTTGAGTPGMVEMKGRINTALQSAGLKPWFDQRGIANVQEIQKNAANLAQQQAAAYGGQSGATDAKLQAAFASLPDANKAPQAIREIVGILSASEDALQARGQASAAYFRAHGATPTSYTDFSSSWTRNASPELFQRLAAARAGNAGALTAGLTKAQASALRAKYNSLKAMGAFAAGGQ